MYHLDIIETNDLTPFRDPWKSLEKRSQTQNIFYSYLWAEQWYLRFGNGRKLVLWIYKDEGGEWHFLLPFIQVPSIGGNGLWPVSYHTIDWVNPVYGLQSKISQEELQNGLTELLKIYQFIWLPLLRNDLIAKACKTSSNRKIIRPASKRSYFTFDCNERSDFLKNKWGNKQSKNISYLNRKLATEGAVNYEVVVAENFNLDEIIQVELKSWKYKDGQSLFNIKGLEDVYRNVLPSLIEQNKLRLTCLRVDEKMIAYEIAFILNKNTYGLHHIAFDNNWEKFSPGKLLFDYNIKFCIENKMKIYDFLQGDNDYKKRWADDQEVLQEVSIYGSGIISWLLYQITAWVQKRRKSKHVKSS